MRDLFDLEGEVALVTGASSGIGAHFASVLVDHGASVALVARRVEELDRLKEMLMPKCYHSPSAGVGVYPADVRDEANITWVFDQVKEDLGAISILINNAGIGHLDRALTIDGETWDRVLDTDLRSQLWYAQMAAQQMRQHVGKGSIINMGSVFGQFGSKGMIAYAVAKAGLIQMTKCLALELAEFKIRVNALAPGWCVTDMTRKYLESSRGATIVEDIPLGRFAQPDDLDGAMLLLASDAGRYITGSTITIDGGMSVWLRDGHKAEKTDETIRTRNALLA